MAVDPRLRTVLVTNDSLNSLLALSEFLREFGEQIVGVFVTTKLPGEKSNLVGTLRMLRQSGVRYTGFKILTNVVLPPLARAIGRSSSVTEFLRRLGHSPAVLRCATINAPDVQARIAELRPALLLGAGATHVFSASTLALPSVAAINLHPSLLPRYAGISPYFWALANGDERTGATLHQMVARLDAGPIIEQRARPLAEVRSVLELNDWTWEANSRMLIDFYRRGASLADVRAQDLTERSYVRHPDRGDVARFRRGGRTFVRLADAPRFLRRLDTLRTSRSGDR
jgi:methionyl-tRNA formyltransferase